MRLRLWLLGVARLLSQLLALAGLVATPLVLLVSDAVAPRWLRLTLAGLVLAAACGLALRELILLGRLSQQEQLSRLLERAAPELGDRITTSVLLSHDLPPGASAELARDHVRRTNTALTGQRFGRRIWALLWREARRGLALGLLGAVLLSLAVWGFPQQLRRGLVSLWPSAALAVAPELLPPLVTDISLTYRYPAYLKRSPRTVDGTTGDIVAPRGTEVSLRGRPDRPIESAALLVGDKRLPLTLDGPDALQGSLIVTDESRYRFALVSRGRELAEHEGHAIRIEVDAAPQVQLMQPSEDKVVREDEVVELYYRAQDDFGLTESRLVVVNVRGGEPETRPLELATGPTTMMSGTTRIELSSLRVEPGDRVAVHIEAEDNDTVAGPKVGRSEVRVLKIFSAAEHHEALLSQLRELFDKLVTVLADELENPFVAEPKDSDLARKQLEQARQSSTRAREALSTLAELVHAFREDALAPKELQRALRYVHSDLSALQDERSALFGALESYYEVAERYQLGYARRLRSGQAPFVAALERHILYLEDLLQRERLSAARMMADELQRAEERLAELLTAYKESGDENTRRQILEELDRLREKMSELLQRLAHMRRSISDEYVNPEALTDRDMPSQFDRIQQRLAEGDVDGAMRELDQLRAATQKLEDDMAESAENFGGEAYAELRKQLNEMRSELDDLEAAQRSLVEETERRYRNEVEALRRKSGESVSRLAARLRQEAKKALERMDAIEGGALESYELSYKAEARERIDETERALEVENLEGARESALRALPPLSGLNSSLERRQRGWGQQRDPQVSKARSGGDEAAERIGRIVSELDKMFPSPEQLRDPATQRAMRNNARAQRGLRRRLSQVQSELRELAEQVPLFGSEHEELLRSAGGEMGSAARDLDGREMSGAAGHQREALAKLSEFRRAMEEMGSAQGGQGAGMPFPWGHVGGDREGSGGELSQERVEIPGAEDYRAPDAFRQDILEAMKEPAPDGYRDQVRRYYEEIVK